jgi:glycerophosphoryl diester phosphodiesterase
VIAPENTLAAVRAAIDVGATAVEVDVRRARDGALVVLHDCTLARTTDVERPLPARGRGGSPT